MSADLILDARLIPALNATGGGIGLIPGSIEALYISDDPDEQKAIWDKIYQDLEDGVITADNLTDDAAQLQAIRLKIGAGVGEDAPSVLDYEINFTVYRQTGESDKAAWNRAKAAGIMRIYMPKGMGRDTVVAGRYLIGDSPWALPLPCCHDHHRRNQE